MLLFVGAERASKSDQSNGKAATERASDRKQQLASSKVFGLNHILILVVSWISFIVFVVAYEFH